MLNIKYKHIIFCSFLYILIPIFIFFLTWLRLPIGIVVTALLGYAFFYVYKNFFMNNESFVPINIKHFIPIIIVLLIFVWLTGAGGYFFDTWDMNWRNALFRDMINEKWPMIYEKTGCAFVYYHMFWIVPAVFGKLFGEFAGHLGIFLWIFIGMIIIFFLIVNYIKVSHTAALWSILLILIFFSGLNSLVAHILDIFDNVTIVGSLEGWMDLLKGNEYAGKYYGYGYQYSSNYTLLSWVFNQTLIPWIISVIFIIEKKIDLFGFLGLIILPYAPLPFMGFILITVLYAFYYMILYIKTDRGKEFFHKIFSIPNVLSTFSILPVFYFYFSANAYGNSFNLYVPLGAFDIKRIIYISLFNLFEFLLFAFAIYKNNKKNIIYYIIIIALLLIPHFRIGEGRDFGMRASIIPLFILMCFVIKDYLNNKNVFLIILLTIAGIDPFNDVMLKFKTINDNKVFPYRYDEVKTFSDKDFNDPKAVQELFLKNYLCQYPQKYFFYKYLAKMK